MAKTTKKSSGGAKMEQSPEFLVLRPLCVAIVKNPSETNLQNFQDALSLMQNPPPELSEYAAFPFALHIKMLSKYKDKLKTKLLVTTSCVLQKFEIRSWDMFIEIFQRLHISLGTTEDPTNLNLSLPEDELDAIISCILVLAQKNISTHFKMLFEETRIQILAHSIFMLLQIVNSDTAKMIRLRSMIILEGYIRTCRNREMESKRLFKFLPGIVSSLRKTVDVRVGRVQNDIIMNGLSLLEKAITVSVKHIDVKSLEQPDTYLAPIISEISKGLVVSDNIVYRRAIHELTEKLLVISVRMPNCRQVLLNNLMIMRNDSDKAISTQVGNVLPKYSKYMKIGYEDILEMVNEALSQLSGGDDSASVITLAKLSSSLSLVQLNFLELREFLTLVFALVCTANRKRFSVVYDSSAKSHPTVIMCSKLCENVTTINNFHDVLEIFEQELSEFDGGVQNDFLGCVFCFNELLNSFVADPSSKVAQLINEYQLQQFADYYISIIDMQSTEIVLNVLEFETPRTQSLVDVRKALLMEGLGVMAKLCSGQILPSILYVLVESAGSSSSSKCSPIILDAAQNALNKIASPKSLKEFFKENQSYVLNDLSVRILNLSIHPNSPNALIYLAEYFDFSQTSFVKLVDQVLSRSCDPFSGGQMQYLYAQIFYAFLLSLWTHRLTIKTDKDEEKPSSFLSHRTVLPISLLDKLVAYQTSISADESVPEDMEENNEDAKAEEELANSQKESERKLSPELELTNKICHRVLNFLPNSERSVRLLSMDCLVKGVTILKSEEDALLPLSHIIWQNLVPRFSEKDFVVVRKSFELLICLCTTSGTFLKKRILSEIFPKLSSILKSSAIDSEQVKEKNRKYYTYTQTYKLQLTILTGMAEMCHAIDLQEEELDKVIDGCLLYLNPQQHKNLQDASLQLINSLVNDENSANNKHKSVWMKLVMHGIKDVPKTSPHPLFRPLPDSMSKKITKTSKSSNCES